MRNRESREFHVGINLEWPIWQVEIPTGGSQNLSMQDVPFISCIHLYSPYWSHLHPPTLFLVLNYTVSWEYNVKSSLSICPWHHQELTPHDGFTEYSIYPVLHTSSTVFPEYSIYRVQHPQSTVYIEYNIYPRMTVIQPVSLQSL